MKIKNESDKTILVYFYSPTDTIYAGALAEVKILPGESGGFREDSFPQVKVSVRNGVSIFSPQLIKPGQLFDMGANYILTAEGNLERAQVVMETISTVTRIIRTFEFFDARTHNSVTERTIQSSFESAYSQSQGFHTEMGRGFEVSAGLSLSAGLKDQKSGGKVEAGLSADFKSITSTTLTNTYEKTISQVFGKLVKDVFSFEPGKLYVIEAVWEVDVRTGLVTYLDEQSEYTAIIGARASLTKTGAFANESEMPAEVQAAFNQLAVS